MPTNNPQPTSPENEPQRLSALLKETRLAQGKTYAHISEATGISPQKLQAIEDEDHDNLPATVFVRGFIRIYVKQLDIDPQMALQQFSEEWRDASGANLASNMPASKNSNPLSAGRIISMMLTFIFLSGALYLVFNNYMTSDDGANLQEEQIINPPERIPEPILSSNPQVLDANVDDDALKTIEQPTTTEEINQETEKTATGVENTPL